MNNNRRKAIKDLIAKMEEIKCNIEEIYGQEKECFSWLTEHSSEWKKMDDNLDDFEDSIDSIQE